MGEFFRVDQPKDGNERSILLGWLAFHRNAMEAKCYGLGAEQLVERAIPPSTLCLLGLVRHLTEMERAYLVWALGPDVPLEWVWGDYTDDGPAWDFEANASMVSESMAAWAREKKAGEHLIEGYQSLDQRGPGNGQSLRWNLIKLIQEYARHNGHADLIRERLDGRVGE